MNRPLVSAIIPTYNRIDMIASAVDSVLAQTYPAVEVLVVDDGSTDGSVAFLSKRYGEKIKVLEVPHGGAPAAVNAGVRSARGEFVAFLDSDDFWLPKKIEKQIDHLESRPECDICYCNGSFDFGHKQIPMFSGPQPTGDILEAEMEFDLLIPSLVVARKSSLIEAGLYDPAVSICYDFNLWLRLLIGRKVAYVDEPLLVYRKHDTNISNNLPLLCREVEQTLETFFNRNPQLEETLRPAARRRMGRFHQQAAYQYLVEGNRTQARRHLAQARRQTPRVMKNHVYRLFAILPGGASLFNLLRRLRKGSG